MSFHLSPDMARVVGEYEFKTHLRMIHRLIINLIFCETRENMRDNFHEIA
jgi:hypothetical protein